MSMPGNADRRVTAAPRAWVLIGVLMAALAASTLGCSLVTSWAGYVGDGDGGGGDALADSGGQDDADVHGDSSPEDASADSGGDATGSDAPIADAPTMDTSTSGDSGGDSAFADGAADATEDTSSTGDDGATDASSAPITFVQITTATPSGSASTASATFSQAQGAGDLIVVVVGWVAGANVAVTQVGDTIGNGYTTAAAPTHISAGLTQSIFYAKGIAAAAAGANTVTVTLSAAGSPLDLSAAEYAGLDPVTPLDTSAGYGGRSNSATTLPATATTGTARELIFGAGVTLGSFTGPGAAFTLRKLTGNGPNFGVVEDRVVSATGSYSADAPLASNASYVMQVATFR
jgi:hypothetical protein